MENPVIEVSHLRRSYGRAEAVHDVSFSVRPGRCYGLFGRNGAGKTTTIKCLVNLLRPHGGTARVFGLDPARDEVGVRERLTYVPDTIAFFPWMTIWSYFGYLASFRGHWNLALQAELLGQFGLDGGAKVDALSRGQRMQVALIGALCPEPELLILDEPTSGLDPLVRREFIRTVIGAYQDADPGRRTVLVSTHLIGEFEGLIDEFTVIEAGRNLVTMETDAAREKFQNIRVRFRDEPPSLADLPCVRIRREGRELEITVNGNSREVMERLKALQPELLEVETLSLEQIFLASLKQK